MLLTPPPVAPCPSFQTISLEIVDPEPVSFVPPQANANGLAAGKSTCGRPSRACGSRMSEDPSSPAEQQTVTPRAAASCRAWLNAFRAWLVLASSGEPQLMEMTEGLRTLSCSAAVTAVRKPSSVLWA